MGSNFWRVLFLWDDDTVHRLLKIFTESTIYSSNTPHTPTVLTESTSDINTAYSISWDFNILCLYSIQHDENGSQSVSKVLSCGIWTLPTYRTCRSGTRLTFVREKTRRSNHINQLSEFRNHPTLFIISSIINLKFIFNTWVARHAISDWDLFSWRIAIIYFQWSGA